MERFSETKEFKEWMEAKQHLRNKTLSAIRKLLEPYEGKKITLSVEQDGVKAVQCSSEYHGQVRVFFSKEIANAEEITLGLLCNVATELYYTLEESTN